MKPIASPSRSRTDVSGGLRSPRAVSAKSAGDADAVCPACGASVIQEKCKVVCRSADCTYRIIYNCSEF